MTMTDRKFTIRVGSLIFKTLGQLLPHQMHLFHSLTSIYPVSTLPLVNFFTVFFLPSIHQKVDFFMHKSRCDVFETWNKTACSPCGMNTQSGNKVTFTLVWLDHVFETKLLCTLSYFRLKQRCRDFKISMILFSAIHFVFYCTWPTIDFHQMIWALYIDT